VGIGGGEENCDLGTGAVKELGEGEDGPGTV